MAEWREARDRCMTERREARGRCTAEWREARRQMEYAISLEVPADLRWMCVTAAERVSKQ